PPGGRRSTPRACSPSCSIATPRMADLTVGWRWGPAKRRSIRPIRAGREEEPAMRERAQVRPARGALTRLVAAAAGVLAALACGGGAAAPAQGPATGSPIRLGVIDDSGTSSAI